MLDIKPIIISAPSAAGKTTIRDHILNLYPDRLKKVITVTTREPRDGEVNGVDYIFLNSEEFNKLVEKDEFIEYTQVFNNMYGSLKSSVDSVLDEGLFPVIILDVVGKKKFEAIYPNNHSFFILPGSIEEIESRLKERNTSEEDFRIRLDTAKMEIEESRNYDYIINNDSDINESIEDFVSILSPFVGAPMDRSTYNLMQTFKTCNEVQLYSIIEGIVTLFFQVNESIRAGKMEVDEKVEREMVSIKESLFLGIKFTGRFGVTQPLVEMNDQSDGNGKQFLYVAPSDEYQKWFDFWSRWKYSLSRDQWNEVDKALSEDSDTIPYMPSKRWNQ
jgi:guanylate kinase